MPTPTLKLLPGALDISIQRGDDVRIQPTLREAGVPLVLPTDGWMGQIRETIDGELLASFTIDGSEGASGIILITLPAAASKTLPKRCIYDIECSTGGVRTYLAGKFIVEGEVTK